MSNLVTCLNNLTLSELSELVGNNIAQGLSDFEISITKGNLIDILMNNEGFSLLSKKNIRKKLLEDNLHLFQEYNINSLINYSWKNKEQKKEIIEAFGGEIDPDLEYDEARLNFFESRFKGQSLFKYQNWMRKKLLDFLISNRNNTMVHMPTGSGKTKTSITAIIDFMRHKSPLNTTVIWLAHSDELCEQAIQSFDELWKNFGLLECKIWRMWGGFKIKNYEGTGLNFIVSSFQTSFKWLSSGKDEDFTSFMQLQDKCDLLIVDEAHMSTAPTYKAVIENIASIGTKRIGLTATPGRHHINADFEETEGLSEFYDRQIIKMTDDGGNALDNPIEFLQKKEILSKINSKIIQGTNTTLSQNQVAEISSKLELPESILTQVSKDQKRFLNVAREVFDYAKTKKKQTLVFCPSKDNALLLNTFLNDKGCKSAAITSDLEMSERQRKLKLFKENKIQVITNFNVLTTGFDAPNIEVVVIARPTLSVVLYSQMIGRGLRGRKVGGTEEILLIDVDDNFNNMPSVYNAFTYFNEFFR